MTQTNKNAKTLLVVVIIMLASIGTIFAANYIAKQLISNKTTTANICENAQGTNYQASFLNSSVSPKVIFAKQCDTLTITNAGDKYRLVSFGVHDDHIAYNSIKEKPLKPGQSFSITLDTTGEFIFHDHYQEEVGGAFTVNFDKSKLCENNLCKN